MLRQHLLVVICELDDKRNSNWNSGTSDSLLREPSFHTWSCLAYTPVVLESGDDGCYDGTCSFRLEDGFYSGGCPTHLKTTMYRTLADLFFLSLVVSVRGLWSWTESISVVGIPFYSLVFLSLIISASLKRFFLAWPFQESLSQPRASWSWTLRR